jgi:hypothetical protein
LALMGGGCMSGQQCVAVYVRPATHLPMAWLWYWVRAAGWTTRLLISAPEPPGPPPRLTPGWSAAADLAAGGGASVPVSTVLKMLAEAEQEAQEGQAAAEGDGPLLPLRRRLHLVEAARRAMELCIDTGALAGCAGWEAWHWHWHHWQTDAMLVVWGAAAFHLHTAAAPAKRHIARMDRRKRRRVPLAAEARGPCPARPSAT